MLSFSFLHRIAFCTATVWLTTLVFPVSAATAPKGYFVGSTKGLMWDAIRRAVSLSGFKGRSNQPIYINPSVLKKLSESEAHKIRKAAQRGQMIVLVSPNSRDITRFRNLLQVKHDIANNPGPLLAIRSVYQDYAEFSVTPYGKDNAKLTNELADSTVQSLLDWKTTNLRKKAREAVAAAKLNADDSNNLINIVNSYIGTVQTYGKTPLTSFKIEWSGVPCYSEKDGYYVWINQKVTYTPKLEYTTEDLKAELRAFGNSTSIPGWPNDPLDKGFPSRFEAYTTPRKAWVETSNVRGTLVLPDLNDVKVTESQPLSNGNVVTTYTNRTSHELGGAVSFLDLTGSLVFSAQKGYYKESTVMIDGAYITNRTDEGGQAGHYSGAWDFRLNEPEKNKQAFPLLNTTTSWIWIIPRNKIPNVSGTEAFDITGRASVESKYKIGYEYFVNAYYTAHGYCNFSFSRTADFKITLPPSGDVPEPELTAITPSSGDDGLKVIITGRNLKNVYGDVPKVVFNNNEARVGKVTNNEITAYVPDRKGGKLTQYVSVITDHGDTNQLKFTYDPD